MKQYRSGFTLVEMLIVIVIIGILAAALIPRLTGIQARARDTARLADMRNVSTALESYKLDNNTYPIAIYAFSQPRISLSKVFVPTTFAQTAGSSLDAISSSISSYLTAIPQDPKGTGISSSSAGECITAGSSYAYYTDPSGSLYAITSIKESKKGNASACGGTIDRNNDGSFQKVGQGLTTNISAPPTDASCFTFSAGIISDYNSSCPKDVVIPNQINGQIVVSLGDTSFYQDELTSIIIPNSVTSIGRWAFYGNKLKNIIIPNSVTSIGGNAFMLNELEHVDIPNSITIIQGFGFNNKLKTVNIPSSATIIGSNAFSYTSLEQVSIPNSVTSIGSAAFMWTKLTQVSIPNSVTSIGNSAFQASPLTTITIPNSVTSIGTQAFSYCGPNQNSNTITNFVPGTNQTRNLVGTTWVKQ